MKSNVILRRTSALLLLFPLTLLTACGMQQKPQVEYRTIKQPHLNLPADLTRQIEVPDVPENMSFGESVSLNAELYALVGQCNIDRSAIRQIETTRASQQ